MSKEVTEFIKSSSAAIQATLEMQERQYQKQKEALEREQYANTATIYGLSYVGIAYCEANGLSKVFDAYANDCTLETIESIGFNAMSGYVYIALSNGVQIVSYMGREVKYVLTSFDDSYERFFDTYEEALHSDFIEDSEEG